MGNTNTHQGENGLECSICWNPLSESPDCCHDDSLNPPDTKRAKMDSSICNTSCGHLFHRICLEPWLAKHENCPTCRTRITGQDLYPVYLEVDKTCIKKNEYPRSLKTLPIDSQEKDKILRENSTLKVENEKLKAKLKKKEIAEKNCEQIVDSYSVGLKLTHSSGGTSTEQSTIVPLEEPCQCGTDKCQDLHQLHALLIEDYEELEKKQRRDKERGDLYEALFLFLTNHTDNGAT